jgi:hypothetical protein
MPSTRLHQPVEFHKYRLIITGNMLDDVVVQHQVKGGLGKLAKVAAKIEFNGVTVTIPTDLLVAMDVVFAEARPEDWRKAVFTDDAFANEDRFLRLAHVDKGAVTANIAGFLHGAAQITLLMAQRRVMSKSVRTSRA